MAIYDHYVCTYSMCEAFFTNTNAVSSIVSVTLKNVNTGTTLVRDHIESGYNKHAVLPESISVPAVKVVNQANIGAFMGRKNVEDDSTLRGTASSVPSDECYWVIGASTQSASCSVKAWVKVTYFVTLMEPNITASSP